MGDNRIPMVTLNPEELAQLRQIAGQTPGQAAQVLRVDQRTACRALAGFAVHRATAVVLRQALASGDRGGRI